MPIHWSTVQTPAGITILRSVSTGLLNVNEMVEFEKNYARGTDLHHRPYLAILERGVSFTPGFRAHFLQPMDLGFAAMAFVVPSRTIRVVISFLVRVVKGLNVKVVSMPIRLFESEQEAVAWIDATLVIDQGAPRAAG